MTLAELLTKLEQTGIEVWAEGDHLRFRAPKGALTPDIKDALVANKPALLEHLREKASQSTSYRPLSFGQQSMWIMNQSAPESAAYNVAFTARIASDLNIPALRQTFQAILDRHPTLRTVYALRDGAPVQATQGSSEIAFETVDASGMTPDALEAAVLDAYERPFNLENGPVLRVHIFTVAPQDHIILIAVHHIALDGWSMWLLLDDLRALYPSHRDNQPVALPRLETTYADYVEWQSGLLNGADGDKLWNYWKIKLSGSLPVLELPTDHPRPPLPSYQGASASFTLDEDLTRRLKDLAKAEGVTLYTLLLTVFAIMLYRYTGQDDLLIGAPTFGRSKNEFAKLIGHFINTVVLRADCSGQPTFREFLGRSRQMVLEMLENQDYPFPLLVQRLGVKNDPSRSPLFQVVFDLQRVQQAGAFSDLFIPGKTDTRVELGGLTIEGYPMHQQEGQFDLVLQMVEAGDLLPGAFKYSTDLFEPATVERMIGHFRTLLESIVAQPDASIAGLPMLTPAEREQLLVEWNDVQNPFRADVCVHQVVEEQVTKTPDAVAVIHRDERLTYAELDHRANQLAHYLRKQGIKPDSLVGLCIHSSLDAMVGKLGVLKAGGAYVPIDADAPEDRIEFILSDLGASVLLTESAVGGKFGSYAGHIVRLDTDWTTVAQESDATPSNVTQPENNAYLIYTSGSTGKPKGVPITHRGLMNLVTWHQRAFGVTASDRATQIANLAFDASVWETWPYLTIGASVNILDKIAYLSPEQVRDWLLENRITVSFVPTPVAETLMALQWSKELDLRYLLIGGDKVHHYPPASLPFALVNNYGPTESTVVTTSGVIPAESGISPAPSLGRPIDNTYVYILDANLQPVPIGVAGELHISSVGLTPGYLNRLELTEEKFIPNPFGDSASSRLYKTGDLTRYLPNGEIEYLGRIDHQVKLRGFRIELGEIEAVLLQHTTVHESLVLLREDTPGDKHLVGYVVAHFGQVISVQELRDHLKAKLPVYMVPSAFVVLDAMPITPNGKIDRRALPPPEYARLERTQAVVPPETATEKMIAEIWREALKVDQISLLDNFFDLGGHSLLSIQIINQLTEKTGVKLDPAVIRLQTLGQLAATYDEALTQGTTQEPESGGGLARRLLQIRRRTGLSDQS